MISKISPGFKITIPNTLRNKLNITENDKIEWKINEKGVIELIPIKKSKLNELIGIISDENMDAVQDCETISKGDKIQ